MKQQEASSARHSIGIIARKTGLKPDLIRAWERRYSAVAPGRTQTRRRFYSDADVERLLLLRRAVATGRGIGQIAHLSNDELRAIIAREPARPFPAAVEAPPPQPPSANTPEGNAEPYLELCLAATRRLDIQDLERHLARAMVALSRHHLLDSLLVPLLHRIGDLWQRGELRPVHEHMATAVVRSFLGSMRAAFHASTNGPLLLVTTPARQLHELGALIAAATAATDGWRVTYLGCDLPAEEIAGAAVQLGAKAVALSIIYPLDDALLHEELRHLRRLLPRTTELIVGGRAATAYATVLDEIGAIRVESLRELREELDLLRSVAL
ncbi:MAG TPA: transcriptional regulator [Acidobacteria bacterium]|nr:transcriptional regulator [Acidobacteriota bacterium]